MSKNIFHHLEKAFPLPTHYLCSIKSVPPGSIPPFLRDRKLSIQTSSLMADLCQLPKTKVFKEADLKKKEVRGTFHLAKGIITPVAQQVSGDTLSTSRVTHLTETNFIHFTGLWPTLTHFSKY